MAAQSPRWRLRHDGDCGTRPVMPNARSLAGGSQFSNHHNFIEKLVHALILIAYCSQYNNNPFVESADK
jgi:hypothetical protein